MVKIKDYAYNISFYTIDSTGLFNYECSVLRNKTLGDFLISENAISVEKDHELNKVIDEYDLDEDNYFLVTVTKEMVSTIQKNLEKFGLYNFTLSERNYIAVVNRIYFATVTLDNADSSKTVPLVSKSNKQSTNKTYNIFNVCAYIIYYYSKHDSLISNLKLQKVLYFLQAYFLVNKHHPLFRNDILFCDWGVFVEEAYNYYKSYAGLSISEREIYVRRLYHKDSLFFDTVPNDIECFSVEDKELMDIVLNKTLSYSSTRLLELSSKQVENMNLVYYRGTTKLITRKEIVRYFNKQ